MQKVRGRMRLVDEGGLHPWAMAGMYCGSEGRKCGTQGVGVPPPPPPLPPAKGGVIVKAGESQFQMRGKAGARAARRQMVGRQGIMGMEEQAGRYKAAYALLPVVTRSRISDTRWWMWVARHPPSAVR